MRLSFWVTLPKIRWTKDDNGHSIKPSNSNCPLKYSLIDSMSFHNLSQLNHIYNKDGKILDRVLTHVPHAYVT